MQNIKILINFKTKQMSAKMDFMKTLIDAV